MSMNSASRSCSLDESVFEIEDFTIVTLNEGLAAELEQLLRKWGSSAVQSPNDLLDEDLIDKCEWVSKSEVLKYGNHSINVAHYWPTHLETFEAIEWADDPDAFMTSSVKQMHRPELDFCVGSVLTKHFGVMEFVLLSACDQSRKLISNENQLRSFLSVVADSVSKASCSLPVFVQYDGIERQIYFGISQNTSMRTNFGSVHLRYGHPLKCHLSGCLEIFKDALQMSPIDEDSLRISVQFDYVLQDQITEMKKSHSLAEFLPAENLYNIDLLHLPFGIATDAIHELGLSALWSNVPGRSLKEQQHSSNIDPINADCWKVWVCFDDQAQLLMCSLFRTLLDAAESNSGMIVLNTKVSSGSSARQAFSSLVSPVVMHDITIADSISDDFQSNLKLLQCWIKAIFEIKDEESPPDTVSSSDIKMFSTNKSSSAPGVAIKEQQKPTSLVENELDDDSFDQINESLTQKLQNALSDCKTSPKNCLTTRIAFALAQVLACGSNSLELFCQLWMAFVHQLRESVSEVRFLPGMDKCTTIDLSSSILRQKLQLLQCAVGAKIVKISGCANPMGNHPQLSDDDLYFDAMESPIDDGSSSDDGAKGRLKILKGIKLLNFPDKSMYEPVTQVRLPLTEDQIEQQTRFLASLDGSSDRIKAQLKPLFSDMEAFKAANPGCCFEDFVRWHSPRDFAVDEETGERCLSSRMTGENNTWLQTWQEAQPKSIKSQQMLFDYTKETNSVLAEFENMTVAQLITYILPILLQQAAVQLIEEAKPYLSLVEEVFIKLCRGISRCNESTGMSEYLEILRSLREIEATVAKCNALYSQITATVNDAPKSEVRQLVISMVRNACCKRQAVPRDPTSSADLIMPVRLKPNSPLGNAFKNLFFPPSFFEKTFRGTEKRTLEMILEGNAVMPYRRRQYTLHLLTRRPGLGSRPVPHRFYASISKEEYRLCLALSNDIVLT